MTTDLHEQLSDGVGAAVSGDDSDSPTVRIVPISEGERTVGQSGQATIWDREPLREAVESGALDGTLIVKGEGGTNPHFPMDEQVPPENILGRVESWDYEDGVGPVGESDMVDEQMAKRIDAGLLEVSADLERHLGEYDAERDAYAVDSVIAMPRVTVLERGASPNASIATVEALGYNPDGENRIEQLASTHSPTYDGTNESGEWSKPAMEDFDTDDLSEIARHFLASTSGFDSPEAYGDLKLPVVSPSGTLYLDALESAHQLAGQTDGLSEDDVSAVRSTAERLADEAFGVSLTEEQNSTDTEQLAGLYTLRFTAFGEMFGAEFLNEAVANLNALDGVMATRSADQVDPSLVAVVDDQAADLNTLNEDIVDALDETPFEVFDDFDWLDRADPSREHLADVQSGDESAESDAGNGADTTPSDMPDDDVTKEQLREQLAAAKAERDRLETERDTLEDKTESLESEVDEKEAKIESKAEELEAKEETIEDLEAENEPLRKALAARAADGSSLSADVIASSDVSNDDLAASIVENEGLADGEDADTDPIQMVSEQLAQSPAQRGQSPGDDDPDATPPDEEQLAAADDWSYEVLSGRDIQKVSETEQLSPRDLATEKTGVDPAQCTSREQFVRKAQAAANGDGGEN